MNKSLENIRKEIENEINLGFYRKAQIRVVNSQLEKLQSLGSEKRSFNQEFEMDDLTSKLTQLTFFYNSILENIKVEIKEEENALFGFSFSYENEEGKRVSSKVFKIGNDFIFTMNRLNKLNTILSLKGHDNLNYRVYEGNKRAFSITKNWHLTEWMQNIQNRESAIEDAEQLARLKGKRDSEGRIYYFVSEYKGNYITINYNTTNKRFLKINEWLMGYKPMRLYKANDNQCFEN